MRRKTTSNIGQHCPGQEYECPVSDCQEDANHRTTYRTSDAVCGIHYAGDNRCA